MRLVSQNGNVDIPYEKAHILCNMECVMARVGNYEYTLGKYSDKSKALKVMEMLREEYLKYCTARTSEYWFAFNNPKVFKFPVDEEVEVQDE